ncbi:MAG: DUF1415 domain-containing protein [Planctomycetaceae bacterium]|nr:DUF1415 domain-containing protein [Planctomycetaceae bacterium]
MTVTETDRVRRWVEQAVLGLGLCPFAGEPWHSGRVRLAVATGRTEKALLAELQAEISLLDQAAAEEIETTLLLVPHLLLKFADYTRFLGLAEELLEREGWAGDYQLASFHPAYQFEGTRPADAENLTNRSPCPLLHVLRESSVSRAVASHPDPEQIFSANMATVRGLSAERRQEIFGPQSPG